MACAFAVAISYGITYCVLRASHATRSCAAPPSGTYYLLLAIPSYYLLLTAHDLLLHARRSCAAPPSGTYYLLYHLTASRQAELRCPSFLPADVKSLIEGLLIRDPLKRLGSGETDIKELEVRGSK